MVFLPSLLLLACCAFSWSEARKGPLNYGMNLNRMFESESGAKYSASESNYTTYYIEQPLDHNNPSNKETFRQRYWVDDSYYKPGGPIIFNNAGESNAYPADGLLSRSVFNLMAKELNGIVIILEHRFYGESHPPLSEKPQWEYLTANQSLADMANFMQQKKLKGIKGDISAPKTKWIVRGGSYSGNLSAWMRKLYPELVFAAVSSSGPVQAQYNFYQYFNPIIQYGPPRCVNALHNIVERIDQFLESKPSESENAKFKAAFGVDSRTPDADFADEVMGLALGLWQQASPKQFPFDEVCSLFTNVKDPKKQFQVYQKWVKNAFTQQGEEQDVGTDTNGEGVGASSDAQDPYLNSWMWQVCSEFGYWQVNPPANTTWFNRRVTSKYVTTDYYDEQCKQYFNRSTPPAIQSVNDFYEGWDLHLNRTIWINGEWDPWRPLSVASDDAPKRQNSTFELSFVIPHGVHCYDYSVAPGYKNSLTELHKTTISTLKQWLK